MSINSTFVPSSNLEFKNIDKNIDIIFSIK